MTQAALDKEDDDKPLDPAVERVRRRMMRLQLVSAGVMIIGLMAVGLAIVYKSGARETAVAPAPVAFPVPGGGEALAGRITLPTGARVVSHGLSGGMMTIQAELAGGGVAIFVYDIAAGRMAGRFDIVAE